MLAKAILYRGSIVIYYSKNEQVLRKSTGIKLNKAEWDSRNELVKETSSDFVEQNELITERKKEINNVILDATKNGIEATVALIQSKLGENKLLSKRYNDLLIDWLTQYVDFKEKEFAHRDNESIKDYQTLISVIKKYEKYKNIKLLLSDINKKFILNFNQFLFKKHEYLKEGDAIGGLEQSTIIKRFNIFKYFVKHLIEEEGFDLPYEEIALQIKKLKLKKGRTVLYTLSIPEIKKLEEIKFTNETQQKVIDLFLFCCHTGLRWRDMTLMKKDRIVPKGKRFIIDITTNKTKERCLIPLTNRCLKLLKKYEYNFNRITNQKANVYLKEALKSTELFDDNTNEMNNAGEYYKRWEMISWHNSRHSFITNLVNSKIQINVIMQFTGHRQLQTFEKYIDLSRPIDFDAINIFE